MNQVDAVLSHLLFHWGTLRETFDDYLSAVYQILSTRRPALDYLLAGHVASGSVEAGVLGSQIHQWWRIDDSGCRSHQLLGLPHEDDSLPFWNHPIARFLISGDNVLLGERLGDNVSCRKRGVILNTSNGELVLTNLSVQWASTWSGK